MTINELIKKSVKIGLRIFMEKTNIVFNKAALAEDVTIDKIDSNER